MKAFRCIGGQYWKRRLPIKILIIEDDREILEVVMMGFEIRWPALDLVWSRLGTDGAELVKSERPDVVILDLGLPDINGFDVLKEIRAFSRVPILILTVRSDEDDVARAMALGANDYMTKPFNQAELQARVEALAKQKN